MTENKYGRYSEDFREYIITDPKTPRPWFNYIWNNEFAGLISHTGGGFSFLETPRDNRLTRMRYNCLPWDRPGRYVMVKDPKTGEYRSLSWAPTIDKHYDSYECRHGQGYTTIITRFLGLEGKITYFVPRNSNTEIWRVSIKNLTDETRELEIYSFAELMMGNALNDIINQPNDKHFTDIHFDKKHDTLVATRRYWVLNKKGVSVEQPNLDWKYHLLFTSTEPVKGYDSSLDKFIGRWRSEANPEAVENGKMFNTEITAGDPVVALQNKITLAQDETVNFAILMGVAPKNETDNEFKFKHLDWENLKKIEIIDSRFDELKKYWADYLSHFTINTPDEKINASLNVWNQYQAAVTFDMARNSGYYHGGLLFGNGIRDQFQDILGMLLPEPGRVKARMLNALKYQFINGSTLHNFYKISEWGERTNHSDTPLWIPFGITEYLNETGDISILDEVVPFYDEGSATVYEHTVLAIDFAISAVSERGLPKIMNGDWNDTLDKVGPRGKGETIWGAFFLGFVIKKALPLLQLRNDDKRIADWNNFLYKLDKTVNEVAWDGEWYIRAFNDFGQPLGTHDSKQGKIFINSQSWAIISGMTNEERSKKCIESVKTHLLRTNGVQICSPSYTMVEENTGLISRCVPGKKENGAIFNHASSWFVLAAILAGETDLAVDIYQRMLPANSSRRIDTYEVEPYVFAEYVTSPDHPTEGQASHSWLTGTAVWMLRIGMDNIAGFKPELNGMKIEPALPSFWEGFSASRKFRGCNIILIVKKATDKTTTGLYLNGVTKLENNFIPLNQLHKGGNLQVTCFV
ncbi:MAG: glycosyl transferase family 36 [Ignavibacteriales bacterium]|nr:MAG: glycosyl transferase family 36 [Ignavibacteriaceae bacterium]MBW7872228.1 glycosyl transferase family 36 [Ignavibacteria bacterium]MCZ2144041.1 glycosyl transferase family 36 [Ignavibacteriales bacterium]OQY79157.1 MAG: glycosyl transferase family 36 [Ignavibacteriales bacterium UTCHB3]MBV6445625.1 Cellobiose phosphorylase [Ignavibacteriaceae bacterium]